MKQSLHSRALASLFFITLLLLSPGHSSEHRENGAESSTLLPLDPLQKDAIEVIEFRTRSLENYEGYRARTAAGLPLTGEQLHNLHFSVVQNHPVLRRLIEYVKANDKILKTSPEQLTAADRLHYMTVLGLALTLADTYIQSLSYYYEDNHLRRVLNEGNSIYGKPKKFLRWCVRTLLKRKHVKRYAKGTVAYAFNGEKLVFTESELASANFWKAIVDHSYLISLLSENTSTTDELLVAKEKDSDTEIDADAEDTEETVVETPSQSLERRIIESLRYKKVGFKDFLYKAKMGAFGALSKFFGNSVGLIQFRKGKLFGDTDAINDIKSVLKPMDILQERTPFRATDFFIPGYFGHAAIWLGTEEELKELGLWDHPVFVPLHEKIRSGASILEALRPGTTINPVEHFMDIDDFLLMRKREPLSREELKEALIATATQYGKKYDFNFDVETQNTLVCSELIYIAYTKIGWRTEKSMGRWTINPDAVAEQGRPGGPFEPLVLYTGGIKQTGNLSVKLKYVLDHAKEKDSEILRGLGQLEPAAAF